MLLPPFKMAAVIGMRSVIEAYHIETMICVEVER
jgi:hypothetical protein